MIKIDENSLIYKKFMQDLYKYMMFGDYNLENCDIITDNEDYIVIKLPSKQNFIWVMDDITLDKCEEVLNVFDINNSFVCNNAFYNYLSQDKNIKVNSVEEYGCYVCTKVIPPKKYISNNLLMAKKEDIDELAYLWFLNCEENDPITKYCMNKEKCESFIKKWMENDKIFMLKDNTSKIICFLSVRDYDGYSIIEHAYTKNEYRNYGYMSNLVYMVTEKILSEGKTPVLQTDNNYIPSNKSYQNVGYILDDLLVKINIELKKENVNDISSNSKKL